MLEFSKSERRLLRELAGAVYEAEARRFLEELDIEFNRWREGEILSADLLSAIHEFHKRQARELWSMYQSLEDANIVARGVALGLIKEDALGSAREKLRARLALFSAHPDRSVELDGNR